VKYKTDLSRSLIPTDIHEGKRKERAGRKEWAGWTEVDVSSSCVNVQLRSRLPAGQCYCVTERHVRDQVSEVLGHFNVSVTTNDIFSRCQVSDILRTGYGVEW